jgi:Iron-containing redox enzyme
MVRPGILKNLYVQWFTMKPHSSVLLTPEREYTDSIKQYVAQAGSELLSAFPPAAQVSARERRGMIARYTAVLEGNFIYWMTGAYIAAKSEEAHAIIMENLTEEVGDCHPGMMRRFAMAANACPDASDALAVYPSLTQVRLFIGRLSPAPLVAMMAFFENFIQRFMATLEEYAVAQGSTETEYTQVHGVCDIAHSEGLFRALEIEIGLAGENAGDLYEGINLLKALIYDIAGSPAA